MTTTTRQKRTATDTLATLPWTIEVLWQGESGVHVIDGDRRATIGLFHGGYADHYFGLKVSIASKTQGEIVLKVFDFNDFLDIDDLTPESAAHQNKHYVQRFHLWGSHGACDWYIREPAHPEKYTQAIEEWIDTWR